MLGLVAYCFMSAALVLTVWSWACDHPTIYD